MQHLYQTTMRCEQTQETGDSNTETTTCDRLTLEHVVAANRALA